MSIIGSVYISDIYFTELLDPMASKLLVYFGSVLRGVYQKVFLYEHVSIMRGVYIRRSLLYWVSIKGMSIIGVIFKTGVYYRDFLL